MRTHTTLALLATLSLSSSACERTSRQQAADPTPADAAGGSIGAPQPDASAGELEWDPATPVTDDLTSMTYFVTAEVASVCPTVAQARENECGNSVEFAGVGRRLRRGEAVKVVGEEPVEGFWRALRFTKAGVLPGWVDAERVAPRPALDHALAFSKSHGDAWRVRSDALTFMAAHDEETDTDFPRHPATFLVKRGGEEIALEAPPCLGQVERGEYTPHMQFHSCLLYGDCGDPSYVCEPEGYCDEVLFAVGPAREIEYEGATYTAHTIEALADRFGVFTAQPGACEE